MKQLLIFTGISLLLTGCAGAQKVTESRSKNSDVIVSGEPNQRQQRVQQAGSTFQLLPVAASSRNVPVITANDYSRNLVHELMAQHLALEDLAMVGVTDFSYVDSALDKGTVFTNHLSEAIIYDLHKFGVPVLDYKVTDFIRVTPGGDFVLSRDFEELSSELPIKYVVTGTLTRHKQGLMINARLIQIANKRVISVARTFVPEHIVRSLLSTESTDMLKLKQG